MLKFGLGLIGEENQNGYQVYHYDLRGSTVKLTDASGNITDSFQYNVYGKLSDHTGSSETPFIYNGQYGIMTDGNGLVYMRARYYNPEVRRFVSTDILEGNISDPLSLNRYIYCSNNPVTLIDPSGCYNRKAAAQYAITYAYDYNPDYLRMDKIEDWLEYFFMYYVNLGFADCTNFTSQALLAGEIEMNDDWHYYKTDNTFYMIGGTNSPLHYKTLDGIITTRSYEYDFTSTWSVAKSQYEYFSNPDNGYINGEVIVINSVDQIATAASTMGIQAGDLMYFVNDEGVHHATMISGVTDTEIKFAGHTNSRDYQPLSLSLGDESVYIVRIRDDA